MDLWRYLAQTPKHIVMYGMGNGADKILAVCEKYGIQVEEFFASDDFVRGQSFHGRTVLRFSDILARFGAENTLVLVAFASSLPGVMEQMLAVGQTCEMYIPDVPVRGETLFCEEYETAHRDELDAACAALADERSRQVFRGVLDFRRTGRADYLTATADDRMSVMKELLHLDCYRTAIDAGAYDGDTAKELLTLCPRMERVIALEPDRRNFRKLAAWAVEESRVEAVEAAAWDEDGTLTFDDSGNRNAGMAEETSRRRAKVAARRLDDLAADRRIDFIKYDVEGAEKQALAGSRELLRRDGPDLLVSLYHRTEDLHELILQVREMCPQHKLYVRRYPYIPAWDLNLIAVRDR